MKRKDDLGDEAEPETEVIVTKSGRRLTEADLERRADEAEAGLDLSTWLRRPPVD